MDIETQNKSGENTAQHLGMDHHRELLRDICRICQRVKSKRERNFVHVKEIAGDIRHSCGIDVLADDADRHPPAICHKCRSKVAFHRGSNDGILASNVQSFSPHGEHCWLCVRTSAPNSSVPHRVRDELTVLIENDKKSAECLIAEVFCPKACGQIGSFLILDENDLESSLRKLSVDVLGRLAFALGSVRSASVLNDAFSNGRAYEKMDNIVTCNTGKWLSEREPVSVAFLRGIVCPSIDIMNGRQKYGISRAMDSLMKTKYSKYISEIGFSENLTLYSITSSKIAVNMNNAGSGCGSFSTLTEWLKRQARNSTAVFPSEGDLICTIDNEQVIGKTWRVYADKKVATSVVTSTIALKVNGDLRMIQDDPALAPKQFMSFDNPLGLKKVVLENELNGKISQEQLDAEPHLTRFIASCLETVHGEQRATMNGWCDDIDLNLLDSSRKSSAGKSKDAWCLRCGVKLPRGSSNNLCWQCGGSGRKRMKGSEGNEKKVCVSYADGKVQNTRTSITAGEKSYLDCIASGHSSCPPSLCVGDPAFVNPNSFDSLTLVLRHVGRCAGVHKYGGSSRVWTIATMDGLPFTLARKVVSTTFYCYRCEESFFGELACNEHIQKTQCSRTDMEPEFDWVVLRIGPGHYEMNMKKTFMELNWDIFMSKLAECMGFCSAAAQQTAKKCSDNHKAWDFMCIARSALAEELVLPYVRDCLRGNKPCTVGGFFKYCAKDVVDPVFKYVYEQVFTYLQAIVLYRAGIRRNNHDALIAGKENFSPLWFVRNHPKYQMIDICDSHDRKAYPKPLSEFISKNESFSISGNDTAGEGADFVLENVNKHAKSFISHGVPTADDWLTTFRNYEDLTNVREVALERMGVADPMQNRQRASRDYNHEVTKFRTTLRKAKYLSEPTISKEFVSLKGEPLDESLLQLTARGKRNRRQYIMHLIDTGETLKSANMDYVFSTKAEKEQKTSAKNQTKATLSLQIENMLKKVHVDEEIMHYLKATWKKLKNGCKNSMISFHEELQQFVCPDPDPIPNDA